MRYGHRKRNIRFFRERCPLFDAERTKIRPLEYSRYRPRSDILLSFAEYVETILVRSRSSGDIVVMDNVSSYKISGVRVAIEAVGATLLLATVRHRCSSGNTCFSGNGIRGSKII